MREHLIGNKHNFKHGEAGNPNYHDTPSVEYSTWTRMISRCHQEKNKDYGRYGGRGIKVCDRWRDSFLLFLADVGRRPGPEYSLHRIDNNGDYEPDNVKWAKNGEQRRGQNIQKLTYNGKTQCVTDWAIEINIDSETLRRRLQKGWSIERALTEPARKQKNNKMKGGEENDTNNSGSGYGWSQP